MIEQSERPGTALGAAPRPGRSERTEVGVVVSPATVGPVSGGRRRVRTGRRRLASGLAGVILLGAVATLASGCVLTIGSTPIATCTSTSGVIVAVDLTHWSSGLVERGCATTITTGLDALHSAGFTTAGDQHDGPAYVCRINNDPTPAQDACINTPPPSAYWSYWHANSGKTTWTRSSLGAASYQPKPGSVDAWAFGSGTAPSFTPASVSTLTHARWTMWSTKASFRMTLGASTNG